MGNDRVRTAYNTWMQWIFIRHGESVYSEHGRYTGLTDVPLTERGHWEARQTGQWLARNYAPDAIYCSPKIRTRQTLQGLVLPLESTVRDKVYLDERLREISYGEWEGLTKSEILALPDNQYAVWETNPTGIAAGKTGEKATEVRDRVWSLMQEVASQYSHDTTLWFVTHRTVMRIMAAHLLGSNLMDYRKRFEQHHASVNAFKLLPGATGLPEPDAQALCLNVTPWSYVADGPA